jgi:cytochrome c-type biogenesis protein CcmH
MLRYGNPLPLLLAAIVLLVPQIGLGADDIEKTAKRLEGKIMAPCCMANPVSDHYSGAAEDARAEIRALLRQGKTEDEILAVFVARHGELILAMPRPEGFNLAAYALPSVVFVLAGVAVVLMLRAWKARQPEPVAAEVAAAAAEDGDEYAERLRKELDEFD